MTTRCDQILNEADGRNYHTSRKDFEAYLTQKFDYLFKVLTVKGAEYASDEDRLGNFRFGAALRRTTPEDYLWGLVSKHIVAMEDFLERLGQGQLMPYDNWDEKLGDIIIYSFLMDALVRERFFMPITSRKENEEYGE